LINKQAYTVLNSNHLNKLLKHLRAAEFLNCKISMELKQRLTHMGIRYHKSSPKVQTLCLIGVLTSFRLQANVKHLIQLTPHVRMQ